MAARQSTIQKTLNPRNRQSTSLDVEKENFEKTQFASISKAINSHESPVKEKHVRRILIGTFQEKSSQTFWNIVRRLPLQENPIVCWKFCHVLHKLLREGYRRIISDSYAYRGLILDLGKMWGLLREGYGKLIQNYCTLIVNKIDFHSRNQRFPGNLQVTDEELENIGERDVNVFFQLCCEMFDYLDEILCLQTNVFGSLDMSRSNSMTNAGQCRLAPLIPCIQDSSQLYDYTVKVLFKLHASLPPATLEGHRDRFMNQFKILKQFYINSRNLQYFKNLIQVPLLPEEPPNFLIQSDLSSHVTPVVILPQQTDSPENEIVDNLVDLSFGSNNSEKFDDTNSVWSFQDDHRNGSLSPSIVEEKDRMIQRLMSRIEELQMEIQALTVEDGRIIDGLKRSIVELECVSAQKAEKDLKEMREELERYKSATNVQEEVAKVTDKFNKMKDIYNKLREEHIIVLRNKGEFERQVLSLKANLDDVLKSKTNLEYQLKENERKDVELNAITMDVNDLREKFNSSNVQIIQLNERIATVEHEKSLLEKQRNELNTLNNSLSMKMERNEKEFMAKLRDREWQLLNLIVSETQLLAKRVENEDIESGSVNVNCSPEYFFAQSNLLCECLETLRRYITTITSSHPSFDEMIASLLQYFHQLYYVVNCAKVTYQTLPNIELGHDLMIRCKDLANLSIKMNDVIKSKNDPSAESDVIKKCLNELIDLIRKIIPELAADKTKDLADLLMAELTDMDKAIIDAANRIEQMMTLAKKNDTGVKLEVNEKILDACTTLMNAIKVLVLNSKELQKEIVSKGKNFASANEFYQRNNRWTEGLISASKVVALAAKLLVDGADKVISGKGKFEEIIVASQEIAAATAQLVVASRVKADPSSQKMSKLSASSKCVSEATGKVVATVKSCSELIEDSDDMDFSKLTLHQAKRLEMESQVRVLELESLLVKERTKFATLRKRHYHLEGAI